MTTLNPEGTTKTRQFEMTKTKNGKRCTRSGVKRWFIFLVLSYSCTLVLSYFRTLLFSYLFWPPPENLWVVLRLDSVLRPVFAVFPWILGRKESDCRIFLRFQAAKHSETFYASNLRQHERRASRRGATGAGEGSQGSKNWSRSDAFVFPLPCTRPSGQRRREPGPGRIARSGPLHTTTTGRW